MVLVGIIPAFNEAPAIEKVVVEALSLRHAGRALFQRLIVVDNGSTDGTADIAAAAGATVVHQPERGYGAACLAGIAAAAGAHALVFIDGDSSIELSETASLLAPLCAGAELVIGVRHDASAQAMNAAQRNGNRLATALIRLLWRQPVTDLGPFRAIRMQALQRLHLRDRRYGWTVEMQIKAIQQQMQIVEVPVRSRPRIGRSKISGTLRGVIGAGQGILGTIAKLWIREKLGGLPLTTQDTPVHSLPPQSPHRSST